MDTVEVTLSYENEDGDPVRYTRTVPWPAGVSALIELMDEQPEAAE